MYTFIYNVLCVYIFLFLNFIFQIPIFKGNLKIFIFKKKRNRRLSMELEEKQEQKSQSEGSGCPVQQLKLYTAQLQTMMRLVLP